MLNFVYIYIIPYLINFNQYILQIVKSVRIILRHSELREESYQKNKRAAEEAAAQIEGVS